MIAVRDIKAGEELLISYGPVYRRTYPFKYDAYALSPVDGYDSPVRSGTGKLKTRRMLNLCATSHATI